MKALLALASAGCLLAACTTSGPAAYGYKPGEAAPGVISESEFASLTLSLTDLRHQRLTLSRLAANPSEPRRLEYLRQVAEMDRTIGLLEYRLRAAGRPLPPMAMQ